MFLDRRAAIQLDDDRLLLIRHDIDRRRRRRKSALDHDDFNVTRRQHEHRRTIGAGLLDDSIDDDIGVANRAVVVSDLHPKARGFLPHGDSDVQQHEHSDQQLSQANPPVDSKPDVPPRLLHLGE